MFPAAFDYQAPATLDEALSLLAERGDDAKVMSGGMSLIPLLKLRFASPAVVVDIGRLPGLKGVTSDGSTIRIGALTRHVDIERGSGPRGLRALLAETAPQIADPLVRNLGTVGGAVSPADPSRDWGPGGLA